MPTTAPTISRRENLVFNFTYILPYLLRGVFARNPSWYSLWSKYHPDPMGLRFIGELRRKYQSDYLYLHVLTTKSLLVLDPVGIRHVLEHSPAIYADAKTKREGMGHFQPHALTISRGEEWADRRRFNGAVLETGKCVHSEAESFLEIIRQEVAAPDFAKPALVWEDFARLLERIALQILFGKGEIDMEVAGSLSRMMHESNRLVALRPSRHFDGFYLRIRKYLANPRAHSLAKLANLTPSTASTRVENQLPHWLFAMKDTLAENVVPTLALIVSYPEVEALVRQEMAAADLSTAQGTGALPYLEACIQEAMRLWPTTPLLVRESIVADTVQGIALAPGQQVVILNSFSHRDEQTHPHANRFQPEQWLDGQGDPCFNHFSSGSQSCAGKELALFIAKAILATMLDSAHYRLASLQLQPDMPVPQTFDPFGARFDKKTER